jgi:hypothetical protein
MSWNGTLNCTHPDQVLLLLKSSDIIAEFLQNHPAQIPQTPSPALSPYYLVLKKYYTSMNPSTEFRCIVKNSKLIGTPPLPVIHLNLPEESVKDIPISCIRI